MEIFLQFGSRSVSSVGQNRRGGSLRLVSEAVEASPVGTKPPAAVDERISKDGRHGSDAAVSHSITTSSLQGRAGDSAFTPKLVEFVFGQGGGRVRGGSTSFSLKIQKTFIHVAHALLRVIPIDYAQTKGLDHGNSSTPWSRLSTNSRPRHSKYGVFLVRQIDSWQLY